MSKKSVQPAMGVVRSRMEDLREIAGIPKPDMASFETRFFLSQDNSSHWYIVPAAFRESWESWCAIPENDERAWTPPDFAKPIGGSPSAVTFTDPKINFEG